MTDDHVWPRTGCRVFSRHEGSRCLSHLTRGQSFVYLGFASVIHAKVLGNIWEINHNASRMVNIKYISPYSDRFGSLGLMKVILS